jgi:hypothetical protein
MGGRRRCSCCGLRYLSPLAEECDAVGEARPPGGVASISGLPWCRDGVFCCASLDLRDRRPSVQLEGDSPMEEELERAVGLAASCLLRLIVGDDDASVGGLLHVPLPKWSGGGGGGVLCCVCLFLFGGLFV